MIGGALGNSSNISSLVHHQVKLVTASSTIERKADSVAGIAQRVLPSVVSISTESV
ncbi:MAG: peptidase S1, partial [Actinobacteria bacterium]|nr:peptidase S1 [Actinomycetota bacterium]